MDDEKSIERQIDEETGASIAYWKRRDRMVQAQERAWMREDEKRDQAILDDNEQEE